VKRIVEKYARSNNGDIMAVTITEFLAVKEDVKCHDEWN
jgi:hypothetical protein